MIRRAVIPAGGLGTRLLPATKVLPKELFPVIDRPVIEYTVAEARDSGAREITMVITPGKEILLRHFQRAAELEGWLGRKGKSERLVRLRSVGRGVSIKSVIQDQPLGLGHAVLSARAAMGGEPFACLLPDDIFVAAEPAIAQLIAVYMRLHCTVLGVKRIPFEEIGGYGSIKYVERNDGTFQVEDLFEKQGPEEAPSNLGIVGRYVLTPGIFDALERTTPGIGGELQLTDGIKALLGVEPVVAVELTGDHFEVGSVAGFLKATIGLGYARADLRPDLEALMRAVLEPPSE